MTFTIPRPAWVSDALVAERGVHAGFQMFTPEGNNAVAERLLLIFSDAEQRSRRRSFVIESVRQAMTEVAKQHREVYDTEPRGAIYDAVDAFFETQGWMPPEGLFR